ncbi:trypsin-like serine peptidase [Microvirga terrestris]|uniref:Trypsin-like peptidase domain-containing protein n=1 Tax=Microvirga terrestris TaxID=2791024 RepID=A0ABS0HSC6_9HYPH|nr:serine protease [Microvirga terrestris]MBF9196100.1 trypsin-like peptidase domain-containing protein [Microvirga terrestris]
MRTAAHARWAAVAIFTLIALSISTPTYAQNLSCPRGEKTEFGAAFNPLLRIKPNSNGVFVDHGQGNSISSMRLLLSIAAESKASDWDVIIRDKYFRIIATFPDDDFRDAQGNYTVSRWTGRLPTTNGVYVEVLARDSVDVLLEINRGLATPELSSDTRLFSILGDKPAWTSLENIEDVGPRRAGYSVGMLLTGSNAAPGSEGPASWCCSGVMITSDLFLTNWHCGGSRVVEGEYWNTTTCAQTLIDLGWNLATGLSQQLSCQAVLAKDQRLDFAILRVRALIGSGGISGAPIRSRLSTAPISERDIYVVHHAQCSPKLVSKNCRVQDARIPAWIEAPVDMVADLAPNFAHDCDTEPGSSGGAVFNTARELIGIHHSGFARDENCEPVDRLNKGVSLAAILDYLAAHHPDLRKEIRAP